ncbi:DNA replication complex GINS protein Psf3 [Arctopsyche grandis]|uniref:DNA replication complex GINS protein Psf3 n=1 Tax=Arctopsyche grandis TaxID=121162 RepID=UPI00406DA35E
MDGVGVGGLFEGVVGGSPGGYLSPRAVLAGCERVPTRLLQTFPKMGFLDPSSDNQDLKAGTSLELPFWLAEGLHSKRSPLLSIEIPKVYKEAYREILKADACAVDLHKLGMYYYDFGCLLSQFDPKGEVGSSLILTFQNRFRHIMDICQNSEPDPLVAAKLDYLEKELLGAGQGAGCALMTWCSLTVASLKSAPMVDTHRKRKRAQMEEL